MAEKAKKKTPKKAAKSVKGKTSKAVGCEVKYKGKTMEVEAVRVSAGFTLPTSMQFGSERADLAITVKPLMKGTTLDEMTEFAFEYIETKLAEQAKKVR